MRNRRLSHASPNVLRIYLSLDFEVVLALTFFGLDFLESAEP